MQFKVFQFAASILAFLALVNAAPSNEARDVPAAGKTDEVSISSDVGTEDFNVGLIWTGKDKTGSRAAINVNGIPSSCFYYLPAYNDAVTSIEVDSGIYCQFFISNNCAGPYVQVTNGAFAPNLGGTNYDNSLSSYKCYAY